MPIRTISCASCGQTVRTRFSRQKLCDLCAIVRDHNWGIRPRPCVECEQVFWPVRATYKRCDACHIDTTGRAPEWPTCTLCGSARRTPPGVQSVCLHCVQQDEATRTRYVATLRQIIRRRQEARDGTVA